MTENIAFIFGLAIFALIGLHMVIRPELVVEMFERMAAKSNDALAARNRKSFDPSRRQANAKTFQLVGAMWLVFVAVGAALLYVSQ